MFINLARRPDRLEQLAATLSRDNSELLNKLVRIDAVDGRNIDLDDPSLVDIIGPDALERAKKAKAAGAFTILHQGGTLVRFDNHLTEGGVACAMSHQRALEAVAAHPTAEWGLILEDDIVAVVPGVDEAIANSLANAPPDWDAIFLGYHGGLLAARDVASMGVPLLPLREPLYGLYAYMVRRETARQALTGEFPEGAYPLLGQADFHFSLWLMLSGKKAFHVSPMQMLFYSPKSEHGMDSDVQSMVEMDKWLENPGNSEQLAQYFAGVSQTREILPSDPGKS